MFVALCSFLFLRGEREGNRTGSRGLKNACAHGVPFLLPNTNTCKSMKSLAKLTFFYNVFSSVVFTTCSGFLKLLAGIKVLRVRC